MAKIARKKPVGTNIPSIKDKDLKILLKKVKLESPGANFSVEVMDRVFKEKARIEKVKAEKIMGKGFWMIFALFAVLFAVMSMVSVSGYTTDSELLKLLPEFNSGGISAGYQTFFYKLKAVPLSVAGILLASSLLLFIDRFLSSKTRAFL